MTDLEQDVREYVTYLSQDVEHLAEKRWLIQNDIPEVRT